MPYIDGESLRTAIDRRGRLPVRDVLRILTDVTEALAFAHSRGVIHRDIKPGNVLMQGSHALVTDFGVAKALSAALPRGSGHHERDGDRDPGLHGAGTARGRPARPTTGPTSTPWACWATSC